MRQELAKVPLTLRVNGEEQKLLVNPWHTLLEVLRDDLRLTGTKQGCGDGNCGACTVLVDRCAVDSCLMLAVEARDHEVLTVEGLAQNGELDPLQEAFMDADAVQCGFCTPGMIMAAKALLNRNPAPTRGQIANALGHNLCRCTGYTSILEAIARVVDSGQDVPSPGPQVQREARRRADARDKVLGTALYAADLTMPDMLHGMVLWSPHAHAEILHIDDAEARALPGVVAVVTARDVPGPNLFGRFKKDQPVLADDRVRQIGDAVAAVAAVSPEVAEQALSLIRVSYRPIPAVLDPAEALEEGAPKVHEDGNLLSEEEVRWGDVEAGLAQADLVVDETYTTPWVEHAYLEPESALAYLDDDGRLVVRSATQHSHLHHRTVAETMDLPSERVRMIPTVAGGAFGGKTDVSCQCIVALLTLKTGRPVKIVYTRAESFESTTKRHPFRIRCRTGVTRDGRLTALEAEMLANTGAYASSGTVVLVRASDSMSSPYHFPNGSIHGRAVYTNNPQAGAMRGFGAPQAAFALESQIDIMAARLGIDPLEFRLMNRRSTDAAEATPQDVEQEAAYVGTVEAVRPYYQEALEARQARNGDGRWRRGVGVASMRYGIAYATSPPPQVSLELEADGRVRLVSGAMDMGQGTDTALGLIVADELALPLESVSVVTGDTLITPDTGATTGSRVIYSEGNAVKESAIRLKEAVLSTASDMLEAPLKGLELRDGQVVLPGRDGAPDLEVSLAEVAQARSLAKLPLQFDGVFHPDPLRDSLSGVQSPFLVHVTATHVAEVEVDMERGNVRVLRVVAAHDVGRVVFPQGLKSQIEGAVSMGIGFALKEEFRPGETKGFMEYPIPTFGDVPEVVPLLVEMIDPSAGLGAKGAAECAAVPLTPAIANAIADATGARIHDLPATPSRLLALIGQAADSS